MKRINNIAWKVARTSYHFVVDAFWSFTLKNKKQDIIFYCEQLSHYQNIESVYRSVLANSNLSIMLITKYRLPNSFANIYPPEAVIKEGFPPRRLSKLRTRLLYTAYSGMPREFMPRDCKIIHSLHSIVSLDGVYRDHVFDSYDYILCAGPHHFTNFKVWAEKSQKLRGKTLVPAGYPKLDRTIAKQRKYEIKANKFTVLYAPTLVYSVNEELASLRKYGAKIVEVLVHAGYNVIFRPHPVSYDGVDRELITSIEKKYSGTNAFSLDCSKDYFESYAKADVLVTDLSGTGFTFSLAFLRPTIFFSVNREAEKGLVGIQFSDREKIGAVVHNMDDLIVNIDQLRNDDCSKYIASYRAQNIFNVENSTNYIVGAIDKILAGQRDNDWLVL